MKPKEKNAPNSPELENLMLKKDQDKIAKTKGKKWLNKRYLGFLCGFLSALTLAFATIFVRLASRFSGSEMAFITNLVILLSMLAFICVFHRSESLLGPREHRTLICMRSSAVIVAIISMTSAVKLLDPADASVIKNTNVIVVALLARIFFKEMLGFIHIICLILATLGVFFIAQPPFMLSLFSPNNASISSNQTVLNSPPNQTYYSFQSAIGLGLAILGAFSFAVATILLKRSSNLNIHWSIMLAYQGYVGVPACLIVSFLLRLFGIEKSQLLNADDFWLQCFYALLSAFGTLFSHLFLNIGLNYEDSTKLSIIRMTDLVFVFILQMIILDIYANYLSIIGAILIFVSTFLVISYKIIEKKYDEDAKKRSIWTRFIFYKI